MSIRGKFPEQRPTLNLNFSQSKILDPRITFTRTSTATYVDENGFIKIADSDVARFDHDPVTGECLGLLVEESRVTYQTYTEDPTQWVTSNMVPTGNSVVLPTGEVSTTIEYKGETIDANNKFIRPTVSVSAITAGDTWTYSGFYKKGVTNGERYVHIVLQNNTASEGTGRRFDFDTGTWATSQSLNNVTVADSGYEVYPNGWYRIWMSCTFPSASTGIQTLTRLFINSTSIPYDTSFSLWGAQLEKASFMTSYIPNNTSSTITRSADVVTIEGENFLDWYNQTEGTVYCAFKLNSTSTARVFNIDDGTNTNRISGLVGSSLYQTFINPAAAGPTASFSNIFDFKIASGHQDNNIQVYVNSIYQNSNTSITIPKNLNTFRIGNWHNGTFQGTTISKLTYYPSRLPNDQLQSLTK